MSLDIFEKIFKFMSYFFIIYVLILNIINVIQMFYSIIYVFLYSKKVKFHDLEVYKKYKSLIPISILVPAYNEEITIIENIKSLLSINYSSYEIIVINDGSTDKTLEKIVNCFKLTKTTINNKFHIETKNIKNVYYNSDYPNLLVVDKENGGKSDSLNVGINVSRYPYFVAVDADSILDDNAILRIVTAFMEHKYTIAVGGMIKVLNGNKVINGKVQEINLSKNPLVIFQMLEYFRSFLISRIGWSSLNTLLIISGAFGAFKKDVVINVGGYSVDTVGEDMELILKIHKFMKKNKFKYYINFLPDPICWTQVPEDIKGLYKQRKRWQVGLLDCILKYSDIAFNYKFGTLGLITLPYFILFEFLSAVIEFLGILILPVIYFTGFLNVYFLLSYFLIIILTGMLLSAGSLVIEEYIFGKYRSFKDILKLCFYSIIENFFYRQLILIFRLIAIVLYKSKRNIWETNKRNKLN